jgi:tetratricopeptide (TPR) repeat protein
MALQTNVAQLLQTASEKLRAGDLDGTSKACRAALKLNSREVRALELLAAVAFRDAQYEEAETLLNRCGKLHPKSGRYRARLGQIYAEEGRYREAIEAVEAAERHDRNVQVGPGWKASMYRVLGEIDRARAIVDPIMATGRAPADIAHEFARLELKAGRPETALEAVTPHLTSTDLSLSLQRQLRFDVADAHHRNGDYDLAFAAYKAANAITDHDFDPDEHAAYVDGIISVYAAEHLATMPRARDASEKPVIIAGMPRSGTTLVEQIIDAHLMAAGGGEMPDLTRLSRRLGRELGIEHAYPQAASGITQAEADRLAKPYLRRLNRIDRRAVRVVNKNLDNHFYIGLIAQLFPGARIIHTRRHPLDTCVSCYTMNLTPGNHPYAGDLAHLGFAYRQYERVMAHWEATVPIPILTVDYEAMVEDQEGQTRRIIEFLDLPWDEACMRFHESDRVATSLSHDQVKQPMYRSSVGRHAVYDKYLGPLREALASA